MITVSNELHMSMIIYENILHHPLIFMEED